jgi:hypothetical protein
VSHGHNVTVDVLIGSKCHSGRSELGRNVQAAQITALVLCRYGSFTTQSGGKGRQEYGEVQVEEKVQVQIKKEALKIQTALQEWIIPALEECEQGAVRGTG